MFTDSSAVVKLYADVPSAELVRGLGHVVVSAVACVAVPAALWRKHRIGELSAQDAGLLAGDFAADWHQTAGRSSRWRFTVRCSGARLRW